MTAIDAAGVRADSAIRQTLRSPLYRGATIAVFLSGIGYSAAAPQIASYLTGDLGASLTTAGLFYLTNLTAPIAGFLIGSWSDRIGRRLVFYRWCALVGALGWVGVSFSTQVWMPFVISACVLAVAGSAGSQLFSALRDDLQRNPGGGADGIVAIVRMAMTGGWIVGPVLGSFVAAAIGFRAMLLLVAAATILQILPLGVIRERGPVVPEDTTVAVHESAALARRHRLRLLGPLLIFTALYVFMYSGESIKYAYLPIYMRSDLHLPSVVSGLVIGIQPFIELVLMPVSIVVARRVGMMRLMVLGAAFGVAANLCFAFGAGAAGMFAGQILMGGVWGVFAALAILVAQKLLPTAIATASAMFMSSHSVALALGGVTGGIGVGLVGLPLVFLAPAGFALIAGAGIAIMSRSRLAVN